MLLLTFVSALLLSHDGHWFGGRMQTVEAQLADAGRAGAGIVRWQLDAAGATLASGEVPLPVGTREVRLSIEPPTVRAQLQARWSYAVRGADGAELARGETGVTLYPLDVLASAARDTERFRPAVVLDASGKLAKLLRAAGAECDAIRDLTALSVLSPKLVLIGEDSLPDSELGQAPLLKAARRGARVIVLAQSACKSVAAHAVRPPPERGDVTWRASHAMLSDLAYESLAARAAPLSSLAFRSSEGVDLIGWRRVDESGPPIAALLAAERQGEGIVIYCQLPVKDWESDPRGHVLLRNVLWYATRADLAQVARDAAALEAAEQSQEIRIPSGVDP